MQTLELKKDFHWAGILDKNLRVFDIIMETEFGTTYNSYILKTGGKTILFETAKAKFSQEYEAALSKIIDVETIDYIVVNHTEPDHVGSIGDIIAKCPSVKIIATPTAIAFLKQIINHDFTSISVRNGDQLVLGEKTLQFFSLPNLHWPDTMYTYIVEDKTLVTCDSFGSHYAHEQILRSTVTDEEGYMKATKYYFDNILGPFIHPYLTNALALVDSLEIDMICPGHGPVLDSKINELIATYKEWCQAPPIKAKKSVVIPYVSAYGYTGQLAEEITKGIKESGDIDVTSYDLVVADTAEVLGAIGGADGVLFGTPTILQEALKPIWDITTSMFPGIHGGKLAGAFGSYGWSGEGVPHITQRLQQLNMNVVDGFRVRFKPSEKELLQAYDYGYQFGIKLQEEVKSKKCVGNSTLVKCLICGEIFDSSIELCPVCGVGIENFILVPTPEVFLHPESTNRRFLILGGGTAALNSAIAIRERDITATITMICGESELPYDRPMLTKNMFSDNANGAIASKPFSWYENEGNIDVKLGVIATALDPIKKEVSLSTGEVLNYDSCIYALGSSSFIPPIKGTDLEGVTAIRTIQDVEKVKIWAETAKSAVVIGGGVLGLEAAWELRKQQLQVTVLECAPVLMAGKIDSSTVEMIVDIASSKGIRIETDVKIKEISGTGKVKEIILLNGETISADLVIVSTGVKANIALAQSAGIDCGRAVIVDNSMRTNVADIYACGDCAEYAGANIAIWPVASEMGRIAGANATGNVAIFKPELQGMTFSGLETALFSIGEIGTNLTRSYKTMEIKDVSKGILLKYYFFRNIICGATLLGDISGMPKAIEHISENKLFKDLFS